jgi:hypothetical protein
MIESGNAEQLGAERRGWMLGHFLPGGSPLHSEAVEVKWARHAAGECREAWTAKPGVLSISILVRGHFVLEFAGRRVELAREGDFAYWSGEERHTWRAVEESVIVTVRWPSVG